jgi:hypothetical protein
MEMRTGPLASISATGESSIFDDVEAVLKSINLLMRDYEKMNRIHLTNFLEM